MVSTKTKTLLLMSSIAMLATPPSVGSSQAMPYLSNDNAKFNEFSARRHDPSVKPRQARMRNGKAGRAKVSDPKASYAQASYAKASSSKASSTKASSAKARYAKAGHDKPSLKTTHAKPQRHHTGPQIVRYEAYLDRHGIESASYAYVPDRAVTPHSRDRAVVRSHNRIARRSHDNAPEKPHKWGPYGLVAEARRYLGTNPTGYSSLWCAHFMNMVLERSGYRGSGSGLARSFASYGTRVSGPQVGAIAVMSRGKQGGHVGVVSGIDQKGNPIIISGNHGRRVAEAAYPRGRIYAYVMP